MFSLLTPSLQRFVKHVLRGPLSCLVGVRQEHRRLRRLPQVRGVQRTQRAQGLWVVPLLRKRRQTNDKLPQNAFEVIKESKKSLKNTIIFSHFILNHINTFQHFLFFTLFYPLLHGNFRLGQSQVPQRPPVAMHLRMALGLAAQGAGHPKLRVEQTLLWMGRKRGKNSFWWFWFLIFLKRSFDKCMESVICERKAQNSMSLWMVCFKRLWRFSFCGDDGHGVFLEV